MEVEDHLAAERRKALEDEQQRLLPRRPRAFSDSLRNIERLPEVVHALLEQATQAVKDVVPAENYLPVSETSPFIVFIVSLARVAVRGDRVRLNGRWRLEGPLQGDAALEAKARQHPVLAGQLTMRAGQAAMRVATPAQRVLYLVVRMQINQYQLERIRVFQL